MRRVRLAGDGGDRHEEKIAVLMGGRSLEREVSLASGERVCDALEALGYYVLALDVTADLVETLRSERPDAAYIALHGKYGEDGTIQELLEFLGIPYTGPGVVSSCAGVGQVGRQAPVRRARHPHARRGSRSPPTRSRRWARPRRSTSCPRRVGGFPVVVKPPSRARRSG